MRAILIVIVLAGCSLPGSNPELAEYAEHLLNAESVETMEGEDYSHIIIVTSIPFESGNEEQVEFSRKLARKAIEISPGHKSVLIAFSTPEQIKNKSMLTFGWENQGGALMRME